MSSENVEAPARTPGIDELMGIYSLTEDTWEDNLMWFFAVARTLWHLTAEEIPAEWGYTRAEINDNGWWRHDTYTAMVAGLYDDGVVTDDDLLAFGGWLVKVDADFRSRGEGDY